MTLNEVREKIIPLLKENPVEYIGVFGSVARGEETNNSNVDILVKFLGRSTFTEYLNFDDRLRSLLGPADVDLVTEGSVNKFLRPHIERDLKLIYGQRLNLPGRN